MLSNIKISFCMPTRNRANFIGDALESILSQADDNIEIVIVDGASTDNTAEVVRNYQNKFKNIVYKRLEKNGGVDRDMGRVIELARGEYCWLLTDDDALKPGAIDRMLKEIQSGYSIYLCNIKFCDVHLRPIRDRYWLSINVQDKVFNLQNRDEMIEYCNKANSIGALFSYWSSIVLRREEWAVKGFIEEFDGSAYALAASLLSFLKRQCSLKYIRDPLVLWRAYNVSFQNGGGLVKRFLLDFDGYSRLANKYLADDKEVEAAFLKVMTREHPWYTIINVSAHITDLKQWEQFKRKMLKFGYEPGILNICYALGRFKTLVSVAVTIKRKILRIHWSNRIK